MRTAGQTDRHDEANSRFSQFENAPKNKLLLTQYEAKMFSTSVYIMTPINFRLG